MDWKTRTVDIQYLIDAGILFEINRTLMHPFGLAMTVKKDSSGKLVWDEIKDLRNTPQTCGFDIEKAKAGRKKHFSFLTEFGFAQLAKREEKLGYGVQYVPPR